MGKTVGYKVVFSALYNESDEFLPHFIKNFLIFTGKNETLLINLPPARSVDMPLRHESGRVFLLNGSVERQKLGHTLLVGHIESFDYAIKNIKNFDFFCTIASNSLFVRNFNFDVVFADYNKPVSSQFDDVNNLPDAWWFRHVRKCHEFLDFLDNKLSLKKIAGSQIEGLFSSRENWQTVHENLVAIKQAAELVPADLNFPFEEILPRSFFVNFGSGQTSSICHVFWKRAGNSYGGMFRNVGIPDIIEPDVADHICLMKWFGRTIEDSQTFVVTDSWSMDIIKKIQRDSEENNPRGQIGKIVLFNSLLDFMHRSLNFSSLTVAWEKAAGASSCEFRRNEIAGNRMRYDLPTGLRSASGWAASYIFFEKNDDILDIDVQLSYRAETFVEVACKRVGGRPAEALLGSTLEGYFYISPLRGSNSGFFRLRFPLHESSSAEQIMSRPVIFHNGVYKLAPVIHKAINAGYYECYIRHEAFPNDVDIWIGLPFYNDSHYSCFLDIIYDEPL